MVQIETDPFFTDHKHAPYVNNCFFVLVVAKKMISWLGYGLPVAYVDLNLFAKPQPICLALSQGRLMEQETWTGQIGFILASVGSTIGFAIILDFPLSSGPMGRDVVYFLMFIVIVSGQARIDWPASSVLF